MTTPMRDATEIRGRAASLRRSWAALGFGKKLALILVSLAVATWATSSLVAWWSAWPARAVLRADGDLFPSSFSPDGTVLASRSYPTEETILWDVSSGERRTSWKSADKRRSRFVGAFSPDGRTFASPWYLRGGGGNFSIDLIDVASGHVRATVASPHGGFLGLRFREGGSTLRFLTIGDVPPGASVAPHSVIDVDVATGSILASRSFSPKSGGHYLGDTALSNDGSLLALADPAPRAAAGLPIEILLWDVDQDREAGQLPGKPGGPWPRRVAFSPDDRALAVGLDDGTIELWDLATKQRRWTSPVHRRHYGSASLAFSPDGATLASTGIVYQMSVYSFEFAKALLSRVTSGPDSKEAMELILLKTSTGRRLRSSDRHGLAAFSPDGRTLAASHEDGSLRLYDLPRLLGEPTQAEAR